mmetsp:Transcript_5739/g.8112  ORF Transcript_5739/g.8112 Transcript_5739/m.8112 type:complete len:161 (-) Transcript_5739:230-712(-)|eukprot:CAMPEP_0194760232 /NCGR_PEP_ID=MMETSP0323_2-20130528/13179_1 /TAXON_ID=2866 ORGANISM="Crypthecodinium cohnii, Strain Seligo" /NCGR_SAMPLE_ID=MMETSP0323_2 /ASSEMBLY_ACC=CAM_ASM_000346 /LENGTH=160 /DNA_ID=CAMNT_0039681399 /DNA_START=142 /DNA_END=624 /DNA_ORIENTATION=+
MASLEGRFPQVADPRGQALLNNFWKQLETLGSATEAWYRLAEAAAQDRPKGNVALSSGAMFDSEDFVAACFSLGVLEARSGQAALAAWLFVVLDIEMDGYLTLDEFLCSCYALEGRGSPAINPKTASAAARIGSASAAPVSPAVTASTGAERGYLSFLSG